MTVSIGWHLNKFCRDTIWSGGFVCNFGDLIILLISLGVGFWPIKFTVNIKDTFYFLNAAMVTIYWYNFFTVISSWEAFKQSPNDEDFFPEEFSNTFLWFGLKSSTSSFSLLIRSPSFSTLIKSFELLFVKKSLTLLQNFLFDIIPSFVAYLKKIFFAFLTNKLHLGQSKYSRVD